MNKKKSISLSKKRKSTKSKKSRKTEINILQNTDELLTALRMKEKEILHTEEALLESMKRFRDLFEQSPIGVSIHNTRGDILIVNNAFQRTLGLGSFGDISSYNLFKDRRLSSVDINVLKSGEIVQLEVEYDFNKVKFQTNREGTGFFLVTISSIFREGSIAGYMILLQDITERKKIEEAQRLAQLGRLLSEMAHEVNNPLMVISGKAEISLMKGVKDKELKKTLEIILDQCFFAKDIIQRLLRYSRLGKVKKDAVDIDATFKMILDLLEHHFKMTNVKVSFISPKRMPQVFGNEKQLQEVFINILRNSADAMDKGGRITVKIGKTKEFLRIKIEDTGKGMPKKVLERIFEPFFTTKQNGTGLGLAVCHTIIQEHSGELKFESKEGKGTTASILLPYIAVQGTVPK